MNDLEWANEELRAERAVANELRRQLDEKDARIAELEAEGEWLNRADRLAFDKASMETDLLRERVAELEQALAEMQVYCAQQLAPEVARRELAERRIAELERNYSALLDTHLSGQERDQKRIAGLDADYAAAREAELAAYNHIQELQHRVVELEAQLETALRQLAATEMFK